MDAVHDFFTDHPLVQNAGRRTFSTPFKKARFMNLIVDFENAASHKYVVQQGKDLLRLFQKWLCIHFLF